LVFILVRVLRGLVCCGCGVLGLFGWGAGGWGVRLAGWDGLGR